VCRVEFLFSSQLAPVPLYTAWWTEAHVCEELAQSCYVELKPATSRLQVRRHNHYARCIPLLRYPKVIPCTKFKHFGILHFWVVLRKQNIQLRNRQTDSGPRDHYIADCLENTKSLTISEDFVVRGQEWGLTNLILEYKNFHRGQQQGNCITVQCIHPCTDKRLQCRINTFGALSTYLGDPIYERSEQKFFWFVPAILWHRSIFERSGSGHFGASPLKFVPFYYSFI